MWQTKQLAVCRALGGQAGAAGGWAEHGHGGGLGAAKVFVSCCVVKPCPRAVPRAPGGNSSEMLSAGCAMSGSGAAPVSL